MPGGLAMTPQPLPSTNSGNHTPSSWNNGSGGGGGGFNLSSMLSKKQEEASQKQAQVAKANKTQNATDAAALQSAFNKRQQEASGKINNLYGKALNSQQLALKSAYDQNLADQEYSKGKINEAFRTASNDAAIQYERNKRNLNAQAMANGLGTGSGTQQQMAYNQTWNTEYGNLMGKKAQELADVEHEIAKLKTTYQNDVAKAIADNDYKKAAALLDDYNNQQTWLENQAKNMATFGNFAGFSTLYGNDIGNSMRQIWALQNPDAALAAGLITPEQYKMAKGESNPTSGIGGIAGLGVF